MLRSGLTFPQRVFIPLENGEFHRREEIILDPKSKCQTRLDWSSINGELWTSALWSVLKYAWYNTPTYQLDSAFSGAWPSVGVLVTTFYFPEVCFSSERENNEILKKLLRMCRVSNTHLINITSIHLCYHILEQKLTARTNKVTKITIRFIFAQQLLDCQFFKGKTLSNSTYDPAIIFIQVVTIDIRQYLSTIRLIWEQFIISNKEARYVFFCYCFSCNDTWWVKHGSCIVLLKAQYKQFVIARTRMLSTVSQIRELIVYSH